METYRKLRLVQPLEWTGETLRVVDQTRLPSRLVWLELRDYREVVAAIKTLRVRGAPVIGIAAAYGIALGAREIAAGTMAEFLSKFEAVLDEFGSSRPTAVNLFHTIDRMRSVARKAMVNDVKMALVAEAVKIHTEQVAASERIGKLGSILVRDGATVLTHCNTGPLAACGIGTALGVIFEAVRQRKKIEVIVGETRPLLQGARLTAWELKRAGVPVTLITDSMAGFFMKHGLVDCVIVGADRVAASGDVANKIGTYSLAVLARENFVPFYVAAPLSSIDISIKLGEEIPVEQRSGDEVTHIGGKRLAP
ncbi:MAG: S-methyl-5-thioribose-1-phosphate isomerase, partial [Dehalococcoidia bacterium]|nr:S-methyl-5-thioribose-1-phosphate isomerase [Dehalococcoidia bacterium]